MKKVIAFAVVSLALVGAAFADPSRLLSLSDEVHRLIQVEAYRLSPSQSTEIERRLIEIRHIVRGNLPPGPPNPPPPYPPYPPPSGYSSFEAECQADDDPSFDFGQASVGTARGRSVQEVLQECRAMGRAYYGVNASTGIVNLRALDVPPYSRTATCWIDDDPNFDHGQIRIGQVVGGSIQQMSSDCQDVARSIYGGVGSSGLTDIR